MQNMRFFCCSVYYNFQDCIYIALILIVYVIWYFISFKRASKNQEIPKSHTADQPTAPQGRATEH